MGNENQSDGRGGARTWLPRRKCRLSGHCRSYRAGRETRRELCRGRRTAGACGFKHAVPLPDPEELRRFYAEEFFGGFHQDYIAGQKRDLPWWELEFAAKYALFEELLPPED